MTFTPTAVGARSALLTFTDNAPNSPQSVPLTGTGTQTAVTLAPPNLNLGSQLVGTTSVAQTVTLTNSGTAPLSLSSIAITGANAGDFAETNNCGATVAVLASCQINVTFTPTAVGARSATLTFTDNTPNSPQTANLTGNGSSATPPTCTLSIQGGSSSLSVLATGNCVDPNATITATTIDWGDDSQLTSGSTGTHIYAAAGTFTITVAATNNFGQQGSASQAVTLTAPSSVTAVFSGQSTETTLDVTAPPNTTPSVTFQCTQATLTTSSGQQTQSPSAYGINCAFSPPTATLTTSPVAVALTVQTTGTTVGSLQPVGSSGLRASLALWIPFPAIVLLRAGFPWLRRKSAFANPLCGAGPGYDPAADFDVVRRRLYASSADLQAAVTGADTIRQLHADRGGYR